MKKLLKGNSSYLNEEVQGKTENLLKGLPKTSVQNHYQQWQPEYRSAADQFFKLKPEQNQLLTPFDYNSIMLHGSFTFSKEPHNLRTMEGKNHEFLYDVLSKGKQAESDIKRIKALYNC
ncbi:metalloendopeptidase [Trichonephila clavipes]|nr:metalloendopeptidase [Trichonephila clavipes]